MGQRELKFLPMSTPSLQIGWAQVDITPEVLPVYVSGQFYARVSEEIKDPLSATACVFDDGKDHAIFVACDLICFPPELRATVREELARRKPEFDPLKVIFNGTHIHTGPEIRPSNVCNLQSDRHGGLGIDIGITPVETYVEQLVRNLSELIFNAWAARRPGSLAYGLDYAVVGRNRRWVNDQGISTMYGLNRETAERFRHIEGYEDHSVNLISTYDEAGKLTGVVVNLACTAQETEGYFFLSADFWCETRELLRAEHGEALFILPQCSAAGDQTSHLLTEKRAHARMLELRGRTGRQEIAHRISAAVNRLLPDLEATRRGDLTLAHRVEEVELPLNALRQEDADNALRDAEVFRLQFEEEKAKLEANPSLREQPRWYVPVTQVYRRMDWFLKVEERYRLQQQKSTAHHEIHLLRLGEIAIATNPFEYYLDFGVQVKLRSPATQTFLLQLAGGGTYVPSPRSVQGGGYGSVPASNPIGPEGGQILADRTVEGLRELFA